MTGFYRDGCCTTGPEDLGSHTICAVVTAEFLEHQRAIGNDLSTPVPEFRFPGLRARRPLVRHGGQLAAGPRDGVAAPVVLASTHEAVLRGRPAGRPAAARGRRARGPQLAGAVRGPVSG